MSATRTRRPPRPRPAVDPAAQQAQRAKREGVLAKLRSQLERRRATPAKPRVEQDRRAWALVGLLLLVVLVLLLRDCREEEPPTPLVCEALPCVPETGPAEAAAPAPAPLTGHVDRRDRPEFAGRTPETPPWIASFRMQVAARGPRLAECFVGTGKPGQLKWTTSVEPGAGTVSDDTLEPMLSTADLTRAERECVLGVLADPAYHLEAGGEDVTPSRVGLVIEF